MSGSSGLSPADLDNMGEEDKREMMEMVESMQTRDSLRMYNSLVERCFRECVENFRRKTLDANEEKCVSKCTEKFLKHSARVSMRFSVSVVSCVEDDRLTEQRCDAPSPYTDDVERHTIHRNSTQRWNSNRRHKCKANNKASSILYYPVMVDKIVGRATPSSSLSALHLP